MEEEGERVRYRRLFCEDKKEKKKKKKKKKEKKKNLHLERSGGCEKGSQD